MVHISIILNIICMLVTLLFNRIFILTFINEIIILCFIGRVFLKISCFTNVLLLCSSVNYRLIVLSFGTRKLQNFR